MFKMACEQLFKGLRIPIGGTASNGIAPDTAIAIIEDEF